MRVTPKSLGFAIKYAREQANLTQNELAKRVQVSRRWLSNLENGKTTVDLGLVLLVLTELGYSFDLVKNAGQNLGDEPHQFVRLG